MTVIWKFPLNPIEATDDGTGRVVTTLPYGARVLSAQPDNKTGVVTVWALCDPEEKRRETRTFLIHPTGNWFVQDASWEFIATCQVGPFVWHVAELLGEKNEV